MDHKRLRLEELQKLREIHAHRANDRQRHAFGALIGGYSALIAILTAAEFSTPNQQNDYSFLLWLIPAIIIAIRAIIASYLQNSARAEELMQRIYEFEIESQLLDTPILSQLSMDFRDTHVQFYSEKPQPAHGENTRVMNFLGQLPLFLIFAWAILRIVDPSSYLQAFPGIPKVFMPEFRAIWSTVWICVFVVQLRCDQWRSQCFRESVRILRSLKRSSTHGSSWSSDTPPPA